MTATAKPITRHPGTPAGVPVSFVAMKISSAPLEMLLNARMQRTPQGRCRIRQSVFCGSHCGPQPATPDLPNPPMKGHRHGTTLLGEIDNEASSSA
jgi:hypothetical protein